MGKNKRNERRIRIKRRIRKKIHGTAVRPRLSVYRSNKYVYAQLIDDESGRTLAAASSLADEVTGDSPVAKSKEVGKTLAERAREAGIEQCVFDRNGFRYHGRVKALAEGARENGLQF